MAFWRREPKTHERIGLDPMDVAIRTGWVVAGLALFVWVWSRL